MLAINVSSTKYSYIPNQKVVISGVANLVILNSAAHSLSVLSILSRGYATLTPACNLVSPSGLHFIFTNL